MNSPLPPGPPRSASTTLRWLTRPLEFLREQHQLHGDRFTIDLGAHGRFILVADPASVRAVFKASRDQLHASEGNAVLEAFLGPHSLLLLESQRHREERRLLMPAFHYNHALHWAQSIERAAIEELAGWSPGATISAQESMQRVSLDIILRTIFGAQPGEQREAMREQLITFMEDPNFNLATMGTLDRGSTDGAWGRLRRALARIRGSLRELIGQRRRAREQGNASASGDVLSMLLDARHVDGSGLGDDALEDELLTLCVTGFETTATALTWGLYWLLRHDEPRQTYTQHWSTQPLAAAIKDPFVDAVTKEILRIRPVIPIVARRARVDVDLDGWRLPAGAIVAPCIHLVHHREDLYPEPERFRPERFLQRNYTNYEYLPFGGGARRCIGMQLALHELRVVLGTILCRARLSLIEEATPTARRRSVTLAPGGGLPLRIEGMSG